MSLTLLAWLAAYGLFAVLAFVRPVWGIALYFLSFFGDPTMWWWGGPIASVRWNLIAGVITLAAVLLRGQPWFERHRTDWLSFLMIAIALNATFVHFLLAPDLAVSAKAYELLLKFVLLFFLMKTAVVDRSDLITMIMIFVVALGHIGYEVKVNDAGSHVKGRLENIGPSTARASNELGSLIVTIMPLMGAVLLCGNRWQRLGVILAAPFTVNTLLMGKSRGAFLAALLSAPVFLVFAPRRARRIALVVVLLGGLGTLALMRDESLTRRFSTTFASEEDRDSSAQSRLDYWGAGLRMIQDHPLGAGGDGFKRAYGMAYLSAIGHNFERRSVHSGLINEACQWGIQGFALRFALIGYACILAYRKARVLSRADRAKDAVLGAAMLAGMAAFCITSAFGDLLDNEWGYWMVALIAAYDRVMVAAPVGRWMLVPVQVVPQWADVQHGPSDEPHPIPV